MIHAQSSSRREIPCQHRAIVRAVGVLGLGKRQVVEGGEEVEGGYALVVQAGEEVEGDYALYAGRDGRVEGGVQ